MSESQPKNAISQEYMEYFLRGRSRKFLSEEVPDALWSLGEHGSAEAAKMKKRLRNSRLPS